ncbi:RING finger protein 17-like isoform X2 [Lycorma delicatula]|uniref:RING finger protein 17-like isoform X2 n=1 Tax=Lycorma delicatula TaxID=130591 RepID=UPI003F50E542
MQAEHLFETVSIHSRKKYSKSLSRSLQSISTVSSLEVKSSTSDDGMISTRLPVTVRKVINPGSFYVSFNIQIDDMKKLFEDMNIYYKSSTPTRSEIWEKGMICAVFKEDEDQWFRGIIEENLPEDKFQVLLKDIAVTVAVNSSCLATLVDDFCSVRDGAFKCHLAGIVAAGGQKTWPGIAIEVFEEHLEEANNKIFFSQKGEVDPEEKSLPAELWIKHTIDGGPLEPSRHEWRSINKYLIDQGFALPDKRVLAIKEEWMAVPKQGLQCFLWGVKHNEDYDIKTCVELLQENIFVSPLLVKVKL